MKSCFDNYITLAGAIPEVTPRSGLFVTDLPGISINQFEALVKSGQNDVNEFWEKLYKRAKTTFINEVTTRLNNSFFVEKVIGTEISGSFDKALIINDYIGEAGVRIDILKSKYSRVEISTISIYSVTPVTGAVIDIRDDETEVLLKSITIDLIEGYNVIDVFESFNNEKIRVVFNAEQIQTIETTNYLGKTNGGCCNVCSKGVEQINGGGLVVEFSTICSIESFICSRIGVFKTAFWYWIGVELMTERLTSELTNCFTIDMEEAKRLLSIFEGEFSKSISPILDNLKIKDDYLCFDCKGKVNVKTILP